METYRKACRKIIYTAKNDSARHDIYKGDECMCYDIIKMFVRGSDLEYISIIVTSKRGELQELSYKMFEYIFIEEEKKENMRPNFKLLNAVLRPGHLFVVKINDYQREVFCGEHYMIRHVEAECGSADFNDMPRIKIYLWCEDNFKGFKTIETDLYGFIDTFHTVLDRSNIYEHKEEKSNMALNITLEPSKDFIKYGLLLNSKKTGVTVLPKPKHIMVNGKYATAVWEDGSHTVIKRMEGDAYDQDKMIMILIFKKIFNDDKPAMREYFKQFESNIKIKKDPWEET